MAKSQRSKARRYTGHNRRWGTIPQTRPDTQFAQQAELARHRIDEQVQPDTIAYKVACQMIGIFVVHPAYGGMSRTDSAEQRVRQQVGSVLSSREARNHAAIQKGIKFARDALYTAHKELRGNRS